MIDIRTYKPELFNDCIERIWILEIGNKDLELMIPPNQYVNLIIPLHQSGYKRDHKQINQPQVEGISLRSTNVFYPAGTKLLGVRFYAYGLFPFYQLKGKEIINSSIAVLPQSEMVESIDQALFSSDQAALDQVNRLFREKFVPHHYQSIRQVMTFYQQFRWQDETDSIEAYCTKNNTNYTSLNRKFSSVVGLSPKKFERLIKFRKSLCSLMDSEKKLTSIASDAGYFDQAHFIREFKLFINQTPSDYQNLIKKADAKSRIINYNFRLF